jgi:hypothetical protein
LRRPAVKPETKFRRKLQKKLDEIPSSWWESIQQQTIRGTPDLLGLVAGRFIALEIKATDKSPISELQKYKLQRITEAGGYGAVVHPENFIEILQDLEEMSREN